MFLNRLCPLIEPMLEIREGRTRVNKREGVNIRQIVLVLHWRLVGEGQC